MVMYDYIIHIALKFATSCAPLIISFQLLTFSANSTVHIIAMMEIKSLDENFKSRRKLKTSRCSTYREDWGGGVSEPDPRKIKKE